MSPHRLIAHDIALEAAAALLPLLETVPRTYKDLADQARRAAVSAPLNLNEGAARAGRDRVHHWRIAYGSARETVSALQLLLRLGLVDDEPGRQALDLLDRTCALTFRLLQAAGRP